MYDLKMKEKANRFPIVCTITVGTNERKWLTECFRTLWQTSYAATHMIYVDNASSDGSRDLVSTLFPSVEIISSPYNLGFAGANNLGIKRAIALKAPYIFLVNPDTRTGPNLICKLVEFMSHYPEYGIIGPLQLQYRSRGTPGSENTLNAWSEHALENGDRHVFHHWDPWRTSEAGPSEGRAPGTLEHAYVQGAALFMRAGIFDKVPPFDELYHTYYEEVDLCRRVRWAGFRVALLTDAFIEHWGGGHASGKSSDYRDYHMMRNKYLYLFSDPGYSIRDAIDLAWRWVLHDLREICEFKRNWRGNLIHFWRSLKWLAGHAKAVIARRRENCRLYALSRRNQLSSASAR